MKPLASPVVEYRFMGLVEIGAGVLLGIVAAAVAGSPVAALIETLLVGILMCAWMYLLAYRRLVSGAVADPVAAPTNERETAGRTRRRVLLTMTALLVVLAALAAFTGAPALIGGIALGNGAGLRLASHWLARWEAAEGRRLLREPRWRWSRRGARGWGRGRGAMDPQDFYVETGV